jgi:predicted negative regulator of RcsB-dependent stress response
MSDFKKNWPELLYKIIIAILSIIFGYSQVQQQQVNKKLTAEVEQFKTTIHAFDFEKGK